MDLSDLPEKREAVSNARRTFPFARGSGVDASPSRESKNSKWIAPAVVIVALSAAFLGGDASVFGEVVPVVGIALLLWFRPLRAIPADAVLIGTVGLILYALMGFLPVRWLGEPGWHSAIRRAIPGLSRMVTLQPIHSLVRFCVMLSAIFFGIWVLQWRENRRIWGIQVLCCGIALLAGVALVAHFLAISVPGWRPSQGFGPFPNRNQTATLMGMGAMLASGFCVISVRRREWYGILWVVPLALCLTALLLTTSRTPLCLLIVGLFVWLFLRQRSMWDRIAVASGVALLVCSATLIVGGGLAGRLPDLWAHGLGFRADIYQDALKLVSESPMPGTGVGNFEAIFPQVRQSSLNGERVVHPESDWLWMATELGWGSVLFCGLGVAGVFVRKARIKSKRENRVRLVGLIALGAFLTNSIVDVPGHRLGTIMPAMVLASLCTQPKLCGEGSKMLFWVSRFFSVALIALAVILFRNASNERRIQNVVAAADWGHAQEPIAEGLARTPLRWELYIWRGYADVQQKKWIPAIIDFHYASLLEPKLAVVPLSEGMAWVPANRILAIAAWREALRRSLPAERTALYQQMLGASLQDPQLHLATIRLADASPQLAVLALDPTNLDLHTLRILESERSQLTPDEIRTLTRAEASEAALDQNFEKAYTIARQIMRPVAFPKRNTQSEDLCRHALALNPLDYAAAFNLCSSLATEERWNDELDILESLTKGSTCPEYFRVMQAEAFAGAKRWAEAWNTISWLIH